MGNFARMDCFSGCWESEEEWFWPFEPFSKLEITLCKYWTLFKIKISMTCVYKEYEVKIKVVQEQWLQLKMKFFLGCNMRWDKNVVGTVYWCGFHCCEILQWKKFLHNVLGRRMLAILISWKIQRYLSTVMEWLKLFYQPIGLRKKFKDFSCIVFKI